jgi:hypothetical protein
MFVRVMTEVLVVGSLSFTLARYGHLHPEADTALRDRLDALFVPATEQRRNTTA